MIAEISQWCLLPREADNENCFIMQNFNIFQEMTYYHMMILTFCPFDLKLMIFMTTIHRTIPL